MRLTRVKSRQTNTGSILTTLLHIKDDWPRPPPWYRLGTGTPRVQTVAELNRSN